MGPTLDPVLGGYLTDNLIGWIFYNIPIGIIATASWKYIKGTKERIEGK
jgi:hypothetical protein